MKLFFKNLAIGLVLGASVVGFSYVLSLAPQAGPANYAVQASYARMFV